MPSRVTPFIPDHYYHIYNRGVEKRSIFEKSWDYKRFIKTMTYYQLAGQKPKFSRFLTNQAIKLDSTKKIVDIICYCLMPNHFHFLLKQVVDGGITEFVSKISNSYTKYFNTKYDRVGPLLQGEFKSVLIESDEQLLHVSRYIHLNPITSLLVKELDSYRWSSYNEFTQNSKTDLCAKEEVLHFFKYSEDYQKFVLDQVDYAQKLELIKHQLIDGENLY